MSIDYAAIREENAKRYGTAVDEYAPVLLANLYAERTHFIYELLQNAEDALRRRKGWAGSRCVEFDVSEHTLTVKHFGEPFNEADVRGISGIAMSTKEITEIGRFGIGFKSVYAWTDRPEIHSGTESFAIDNYVHPTPVEPIERDPDATVLVIPLKSDRVESRHEIVAALQRHAGSALRFLREIEEIAWSVDGQPHGHFVVERQRLDADVHRVTVVGAQGAEESMTEWLMFSDTVLHDGSDVGRVEIAFSLDHEADNPVLSIQKVHHSLLNVYFSTDHETHLGFLVQGPYRTTPSRDNVIKDDDWNTELVARSATLLRNALLWLRDHGHLTADILSCLPLDPGKFDRTNMFSPLFGTAKDALSSERLLPAHPDGYVMSSEGVLGGTVALRRLFDSEKLTAVLGSATAFTWLVSDITPDRTRDLYDYLRDELDMEQMPAPAAIIRRFDRQFLEAQTDEWIRDLYEFLNEQPAMHDAPWFKSLPLVRLDDGTHVTVGDEDTPNAYLAPEGVTSHPVVRESVYQTDEAHEFLVALGLREFDLIDEVINHVLPQYRADPVSVDDECYAADIAQIVHAYDEESTKRSGRLLNALGETPFVRVIDARSGNRSWVTPDRAYLPTEHLRTLFDGVGGVQFVDHSLPALLSEEARYLLVACDVADTLRFVEKRYDDNTSREDWSALKQSVAVSLPDSTRAPSAQDWYLAGIEELLDHLPTADSKRREEVSALLWDGLRKIVPRRKKYFTGTYHWFYYSDKQTPFAASFVRTLRDRMWIPTPDGQLGKPEDVVFESLGWPGNDFLLGQFSFMPPPEPKEEGHTLEERAQELGVDADALALMKEHNITGDEMREVLNLRDTRNRRGDSGTGASASSRGPATMDRSAPLASNTQDDSQSTPALFRSYVAVQHGEGTSNVFSTGHQERQEVEEAAIEFILQKEPGWKRTPTNNPGFDLYRVDDEGNETRWCEIKSLSGAWNAQSVALTPTQFQHAQEKGDAYWLYVVEYAEDDSRRRLLPIQNPVGRAERFAFDQGWEAVANFDSEVE